MTQMTHRQNQQWQIITSFKYEKNDRDPIEEETE